MALDGDSPCGFYCNRCGQRTNHRVSAQHVVPGDVDKVVWISFGGEPVACVEGERHFEIVQCCGCGEVHFAIRQQFDPPDDEPFDEHWSSAEGGPLESVTEFPPRTIRPLPAWLSAIELRSDAEFHASSEGRKLTDAEQEQTLPDEVANVLKEVGIALAQGANALAAMGLRAVIDAVCSDKISDCGGFRQKLDALTKNAFIAERDRKFLESATELGHAAAHRAFRPKSDIVICMLDIVVHLIDVMYRHPQLARRIDEHTPRREQP